MYINAKNEIVTAGKLGGYSWKNMFLKSIAHTGKNIKGINLGVAHLIRLS